MQKPEFKKAAIALLQQELKAWENGDIKWNICNQFDESKIKSSLKNIEKDEVLDETFELLSGKIPPRAPMLFNYLSSFDEPELAAAWYD